MKSKWWIIAFNLWVFLTCGALIYANAKLPYPQVEIKRNLTIQIVKHVK